MQTMMARTNEELDDLERILQRIDHPVVKVKERYKTDAGELVFPVILDEGLVHEWGDEHRGKRIYRYRRVLLKIANLLDYTIEGNPDIEVIQINGMEFRDNIFIIYFGVEKIHAKVLSLCIIVELTDETYDEVEYLVDGLPYPGVPGGESAYERYPHLKRAFEEIDAKDPNP